jgi:hypothetical protein
MELPQQIIPVESHTELLDTLDRYSISPDTWGDDDTRTSHDLFQEIADGETALFLSDEGLRRYCATVKANIYHDTGFGILRLVEAVQHNMVTDVWRHRKLHNSLSEKQHVFRGEGPEAAILRGMHEELRDPGGKQLVTTPLRLGLHMHRRWPPQQERNYQGLWSVTETHYYNALLQPEEFSPWGYMERKVDDSGELIRETFFHWENAKSDLPEKLVQD